MRRTTPIAVADSARRLAIHFRTLTPDGDDPVTWVVGGLDLSRWTRWRLRRALQARAPDHVTVRIDQDVIGMLQDFDGAPTLECWIEPCAQ